ncbi:MAG: putative DNA binding domain-containing protein [Deltaproteobacteria bacterium]|nr:putative DNA binding domain-containing protein [Deltaproteobacteria bacterium]
MTAVRSAEYLVGLVRELCKLPRETEWAELKENNDHPKAIGEYISALSNAASLEGKAFAYLVWGVRDDDHAIVGTRFDPGLAKVGNEELESWLLRLLEPKLHFRFFTVDVDGQRVVILEIERAQRQPARFEGTEFIRVGSVKKKLKHLPEKERALWRVFDQTPFEVGVARENVTSDEVAGLLDSSSYFELTGRPTPDQRAGILAALEEDGLLRKNDAGNWNITNLGAVLFAKRLTDFGRLGRKAVRVIVYENGSRLKTLKEHVEPRGYAAGFETLIAFINGLVPSNEVIGQALRKAVPMYPELAVRELVANALIHEDFFVTGAGPMVEIFEGRIEVTNPGKPLVATERFVDAPPRSRNEALASLMRRMGICEERGSGVDKIVAQTEVYQLPAPLFEVPDDSTRAVLFAHRPLAEMDRTERVRACYLHACLRYVLRQPMTNSSIRARFGIEAKNAALASRLIRDAVEAGVIVLEDETAAKSERRYLPAWARNRQGGFR